jgi:hypothetical protein
VNTGYNYMLSNRFRIGVEADASVPAWGLASPDFSIGGTTNFNSPVSHLTSAFTN